MTRTECAWAALDEARITMIPGQQVSCSLLGRVRATEEVGELVGEIPLWLMNESAKHGYKVIGADFRRETYTLEAI